MAERVRVSRLERLAAEVSRELDRPSRPWIVVMGEGTKAQIGAIYVNHAAVYGGWDLVEIVNENGGERSIIGNTLGGRGRLKAHEMESFLLGMLAALERVKVTA